MHTPWDKDRMAARVSATAYAFNDAALRFCSRVGTRPKIVTLQMPP